ncbi:ABC-2 type transporter [Halalkalicoccus paucihalophilus]|uniref:ABC-2 type transporter n=1 Tax=Halalkalicoccus paucihalophilus TaxID=1008153 RepID=A0A151ADM9_9EURY|nr:ABC transporter permease [Halalkalicoccus paucihalophilus]KYH25798.1 ABC-2 type transporter [Halalkalicoccus paucihalophilus]
MSSLSRTRAEFEAAWHSFIRRRTAVFFTFFFPVILIVIFGALVTTDPTGGGLFTEPSEYYLAGYLAVVVLFTPISRVGSTVARHREGNRFEKLATTPLRRTEWLLAHTLVNAVLVGIASAILIAVLWALTDATFTLSPLLVPFVLIGSAVFCGIGAILGRVADSQDGVIAAANTIALPMLFLAETFVPPDLLPGWMGPVIDLLPLTYFSRGVREVTVAGGPWTTDLAILSGLALAFFLTGAYALPETD